MIPQNVLLVILQKSEENLMEIQKRIEKTLPKEGHGFYVP